MKVLILDDNIYRYRAACAKWPEAAVTWAQHYGDFMQILQQDPVWDLITLDHDLGDFAAADRGVPPSPYPEAEVAPRELNGNDAATWMLLNRESLQVTMVGVHSANPQGAENIQATLKDAGWLPIRYFLD